MLHRPFVASIAVSAILGLAAVRTAAPAVVTAAAPLAPRAASGAEYAYHHFKERLTLDIDPGMVAVFGADAAAGLAAFDAAPLTAAGVDGARIQASSVPGWHYAELPAGMQSKAAVEQLLEGLARDGAYDFVSPVFVGTGGLPVVITRDVLIGLRREMTPEARDAFIAERVPGVVLDADFAGLDGVYRVRTSLRRAGEVLDLVNGLSADPQVLFAQSDMIWWADRYGILPNDPLFPQQWALSQPNDQDMNAPEAWSLTLGDPAVVVVVLDSGIDQSHEDLSQLPGQTFSGSGSGGAPAGQCDNHGTAVAGCVAATIDNGLGLVGVAPGCRVRSAKIFNEVFFLFFCLPFLETQDSWTVAGITWAQSSGARVTNSSWGGGTASAAVTTAFDSTRAAGVIHFAAAGNDGSATIGYPANLASQNAVAAVNSTGAKASFSQYGAGLFISAPGEAILSTDRMGSAGYESGNTTTIDGTSFASPYTAGVAALVISADPSLTPDEVEAILAQTAKDRGAPGYDTTFGWGIVDAFAAVSAAMPAASCPADFNRSGTVDGDDLGSLLGAWGPAGPDEAADFNHDGLVDGSDLGDLLGAWGVCR